FQAADGIRGRNVTGVQTCALPISARTKALRIVRIDAFAVVALFSVMMLAQVSGAFWLLLLGLMIATTPPAAAWWRRVGAFFAKRSEERRVGSESEAGLAAGG